MMEGSLLTKTEWVDHRIRNASLGAAVPLLLLRIRKGRGLSGETLAGLCNTSHATIHRLEAGKTPMTLGRLEAILSALKMTPQEFFQELFRIRENRQ